MQKKIVVLLLVLFVSLCLFATDSKLIFQFGPTCSINAISFDTAASAMLCTGGKLAIFSPINEKINLGCSTKVEYATGIYNYSRFVKIPDSVLTSIGLVSEINFNQFTVEPQVGIKVLSFTNSELHSYLMVQIAVSAKYLFSVSEKMFAYLSVPFEYAFSANGSSVSAGVNFMLKLAGEK